MALEMLRKSSGVWTPSSFLLPLHNMGFSGSWKRRLITCRHLAHLSEGRREIKRKGEGSGPLSLCLCTPEKSRFPRPHPDVCLRQTQGTGQLLAAGESGGSIVLGTLLPWTESEFP